MSASNPAVLTPSGRSRRIAALVAIVAAAIAAVAVWGENEGIERRAIEELPADERRALYERTLHTLQTSCDPRTQPQGLDDFCREQAGFITQFPECDEACSSLSRRHRRLQTK